MLKRRSKIGRCFKTMDILIELGADTHVNQCTSRYPLYTISERSDGN